MKPFFACWLLFIAFMCGMLAQFSVVGALMVFFLSVTFVYMAFKVVE